MANAELRRSPSTFDEVIPPLGRSIRQMYYLSADISSVGCLDLPEYAIRSAFRMSGSNMLPVLASDGGQTSAVALEKGDGMLTKLRWHLRRQDFLPTYLGIITSPTYIIRRGLFKNIEKLSFHISGRVLDFGCGSKPYEDIFVRATSYIGLDIEKSGHDHANSKIDVLYDGKTIPFENGHFDSIVCFEVFEHVFNLDHVLHEIARVTATDGKLLITIPFAWDEHEIPYDFARYTSYGIRHILESNGFKVVEMKKTTSYIAALGQLLIAYFFPFFRGRHRAIFWMAQLFLIFPLTTLTLVLEKILPRRDEYFCNLAVVAKKVDATQPG